MWRLVEASAPDEEGHEVSSPIGRNQLAGFVIFETDRILVALADTRCSEDVRPSRVLLFYTGTYRFDPAHARRDAGARAPPSDGSRPVQQRRPRLRRARRRPARSGREWRAPIPSSSDTPSPAGIACGWLSACFRPSPWDPVPQSRAGYCPHSSPRRRGWCYSRTSAPPASPNQKVRVNASWYWMAKLLQERPCLNEVRKPEARSVNAA